jgi:hypothetical protein
MILLIQGSGRRYAHDILTCHSLIPFLMIARGKIQETTAHDWMMQTVEFQHKYTELVQLDSTASGTPMDRSRPSDPDMSHHSTPHDESGISGLAPLPSNHSDLPHLDHLLSSRASEPPPRLSARESIGDRTALDRMFTSTSGFNDLFRTPLSRRQPSSRRTCRKLQVAHWMARPVTAVLYVDPLDCPLVMGDPEAAASGFVWWWSGGYMHVHDIQANTTTSKMPPIDKLSAKPVVRCLVLDASRRWVWAGHDTGCAPFGC